MRLKLRTHRRRGGGVALRTGLALRSRERERLRLSRLPLRSRLLGDGDGRRFGDGDERRRRRSGVGDRREDAITTFSLRSARAPARGERERRAGLRARSLAVFLGVGDLEDSELVVVPERDVEEESLKDELSEESDELSEEELLLDSRRLFTSFLFSLSVGLPSTISNQKIGRAHV